MKKRPVSFKEACAAYVHRFTMDHVPAWSQHPMPNGRYPAPQFASDREWYDATKFAGESPWASNESCYCTGQTWPLGQTLDAPYTKGNR